MMTLSTPTLFAIMFFILLLYAIDRVAFYKQRVRDLELILEHYNTESKQSGSGLGLAVGLFMVFLFVTWMLLGNIA